MLDSSLKGFVKQGVWEREYTTTDKTCFVLGKTGKKETIPSQEANCAPCSLEQDKKTGDNFEFIRVETPEK